MLFLFLFFVDLSGVNGNILAEVSFFFLNFNIVRNMHHFVWKGGETFFLFIFFFQFRF